MYDVCILIKDILNIMTSIIIKLFQSSKWFSKVLVHVIGEHLRKHLSYLRRLLIMLEFNHGMTIMLQPDSQKAYRSSRRPYPTRDLKSNYSLLKVCMHYRFEEKMLTYTNVSIEYLILNPIFQQYISIIAIYIIRLYCRVYNFIWIIFWLINGYR